MFPLFSRYPTTRSLLSWVFALGAATMLSACDTADSPLSPAAADEPAVSGMEPTSAPDYAVTATSPLIAFSSYRNGNNDIYTMDPTGYHVTRLTTNSRWEASPAWSWDNTRIAFVRPRKDAANVTHYDIYLMNPDGSHGHWALPTPSPYNLSSPSWAPDGSHILVAISEQGASYLGWINLGKGVLGNLTSGGNLVAGTEPSYNPTGQRITYVGSSGESLDLMNADGTGHMTLLSASGSTVEGPVFSPNGSRIVFSNSIGGDQELFMMSLADGTTKRLTYSTGTDFWPTWSPDGSKIVFTSTRNGHLQTWSMNASGGSATRLSHNSYDERTPAYSH